MKWTTEEMREVILEHNETKEDLQKQLDVLLEQLNELEKIRTCPYYSKEMSGAVYMEMQEKRRWTTEFYDIIRNFNKLSK